MHNPQFCAIGTANPSTGYTQKQLAKYFGVSNRKIQTLFANSHILQRYLNLPKLAESLEKEAAEPQQSEQPLSEASPVLPDETPNELIEKHRQGILNIGGQAVNEALQNSGLKPEDLDYLVCVTSTGYLCPGATALLIRQHGFRENIHRVDVVGMGCNAALNAMQPLVNFLRLFPDKCGMLVCVENCSAAYVVNETMNTAVVNSLFGDAAAAVVIAGDECEKVTRNAKLPEIRDFESQIVVEAMHTMRFNCDNGKLSFFLDKEIPYFLGQNAHRPVLRLLEKNQLKKRQIASWVVHSGGKKVIDSIKMNLDLSDYDLRHTSFVLNNYGNISSCSILFSLKRLSQEQSDSGLDTVHPGDWGVMMAMGPGASIETALLKWPE